MLATKLPCTVDVDAYFLVLVGSIFVLSQPIKKMKSADVRRENTIVCKCRSGNGFPPSSQPRTLRLDSNRRHVSERKLEVFISISRKLTLLHTWLLFIDYIGFILYCS